MTGATGRMGQTVCLAVAEAPDLDLVAAVDPAVAGRPLGQVVPGIAGPAGDITVLAAVEELEGRGVDVVVDFTRAGAALAVLEWCAAHGVRAVSGTTGIGAEDLERLGDLFGAEGAPACVLAPNFSIAAVLSMRFAEIAAAHLPAAEIVELHHDRKRDAPSGTAIETARRVARARRRAGLRPPAEPTNEEPIPGARGASFEGEVRIHAVRLPGLVAHQEVLFGGPGQSLTIRADSYDRTSFVPGVLAAVRRVPELRGLSVGLEAVLGI